MIERLLAGGVALAATATILGGILWLNQPPPPPSAKPTGTPVAFDVAPPRKPPPSKKPPPPRTPPPRTPPPPAAMLGANLSGLAFGISAFEGLAVGASDDVLGAGGAGVVMTESTVDVVPRPVSRSAPEYPARARARGLQGSVNLSVLVGEDGAVRDVVVLEADPPGVFDEAAKAAVRSWRFEPGQYQGRAVPVRVQQLLRFTLE